METDKSFLPWKLEWIGFESILTTRPYELFLSPNWLSSKYCEEMRKYMLKSFSSPSVSYLDSLQINYQIELYLYVVRHFWSFERKNN